MEAGNITDNQIKASSKLTSQTAALARLNSVETCTLFPNVYCFIGWAATIIGNKKTLTWLEIDFQNKHTVVTRVATQGGGRRTSFSSQLRAMWVAEYELHYGNDSGSLFVYTESDTKTKKVSTLFRST